MHSAWSGHAPILLWVVVAVARDVDDAWNDLLSLVTHIKTLPVTPEQLSLLDRLHGVIQDKNFAAQRTVLTVQPKPCYL